MQRKTLIIGSSECAREIAAKLLEMDFEVTIATNGPGFSSLDFVKNTHLEILARARVLKCTGSVGNFSVSLHQNGQDLQRNISTIVIAEQEKRNPNFSLYGLTPSATTMSISQLKTMLTGSTPAHHLSGKKVVLVSGLFDEADPVIHNEVMTMSLTLQTDFNCQVYILTDNLKVAGTGLEALYRKTREAGVVYIKSADHSVSIDSIEEGRMAVDFFDEVMRAPFRIRPDLMIVDERIFPWDGLKEIAETFKIDRDEAGFAQTENVRRIRVATNRKGILVAGPARDVQPLENHVLDASNAVLSIVELLKDDHPEEILPKAEIDPGHCVRCLTCYRLCPFQAVELDIKPVISTRACEGCGICVAECPKQTIRLPGLSSEEFFKETTSSPSDVSDKPFPPDIFAFCCSRSAKDAWESASESGQGLPSGLRIITLPCAGAISKEHLLSAFSTGADGIMVFTCHQGNCHSEKGNIYAAERLEGISEILTQIGFEKERLVIKSIAANMGTEFSEFVCDFEKELRILGPSKLVSIHK